jgi:hypothetical protein
MTSRRLMLLVAGILAVLSTAAVADTLVLKDGSRHAGTFVSATARTVSFKEGTRIHRYPKSSVQSLEFGTTGAETVESGNSPALSRRDAASGSPARDAARQVVIPTGTEVSVRTNENIDSSAASVGQKFSGMIAEDVMGSSGQVAIPKGSNAELVIRSVQSGGITKGPELTLDLASVDVHGQRYVVNTAELQRNNGQGLGANRRTAEMVGGGAALGTLIGAIAGQGKGAAIDAVAGAAAGAGTQVLTRGKEVKVPAESVLQFKLNQPLRLDLRG